MCTEMLLLYQEELCNKRDFMLCFRVCSKGIFFLLPRPVAVVYVSGIKVVLVQVTQENSADRP